MPAHKTGKKNRKHRRNKEFCEKYKAEGRSEKNKLKKQARHLKAHPSDTAQKCAINYTRKKSLTFFEKLLDKIKKVG